MGCLGAEKAFGVLGSGRFRRGLEGFGSQGNVGALIIRIGLRGFLLLFIVKS